MEYKSFCFSHNSPFIFFFLLIYGNVEVEAKLLNIELYQEHCPYPSKLRTIARLRKFERIMKDIIVEQETEWKQKIISIGKALYGCFKRNLKKIKKMKDIKTMRERTEKSQSVEDKSTCPLFFSVR